MSFNWEEVRNLNLARAIKIINWFTEIFMGRKVTEICRVGGLSQAIKILSVTDFGFINSTHPWTKFVVVLADISGFDFLPLFPGDTIISIQH